MTDSDLLESPILQRPEPQGFVNVNLNANEEAEPYGPLISWLAAVFAVLYAMTKHG
jgi:hypothetical protein